MKKAPLILALLLAFIGSAWGAYPTTDAGKAAYFAPLRAHVASLGDEFTLWASGDSWTCTEQYPGEDESFAGAVHGSSASARHNAIWADHTTSNGAFWLGQLAYRLKTHRYGAEAIGGAQLTNNNANPAAFEEDVTIASWVDDAAAFAPDVWLLYGGINDILGGGASYSSVKRKVLLCLSEAYSHMPSATKFVLPTLQPCGIDFIKRKVAGTSPWAARTWAATFDSCAVKQTIVDSYNAWLKDSLRIAINQTMGLSDTSRVFVVDHVPSLQLPVTWTAGAEASSYPHNLASVTSQSGEPSQADSVRWAALRVLRREIESDSIHASHMGLRQIGDSMAVNAFGIDLATWTAGTHKTLYADLANGHNWANRGRETNRATPLATLQCAINRAWPGDTIQVIGQGNQAVLTASSVAPTPVSAGYYEVEITKPGLVIRIDDGAFFRGVYSTTAKTYGSSIATTVGLSWLDQNGLNSGGDNKEMQPGGKFAWSANDTTFNAIIDLDLTIDGLVLDGYNIPLPLYNITDVTFKNCEFSGGNSTSGGIYAVQYATFADYPTPQARRFWFDGCTFNTDVSPVQVGTTTSWGKVSFNAVANTSQGANFFRADSCLYSGWFKNCSFIGTEANTSGSHLSGYIDGFDFVGCTFTDPKVTGLYIYPSRAAVSGSKHLQKMKFINNSINVGSVGDNFRFIYPFNANVNGVFADSILWMNNSVTISGAATRSLLYHGPINTGKTWLARNRIYVSAPSNGVFAAGAAGYSTLAQLESAGLIVPTTAREKNWPVLFSANSDSMMFGGLTTTTKGGNTWTLSEYGVSHGTNHASIGPTQYPHSPYLWPGRWGAYPAYAAIETPKGLIDLVTNGVLPRSDSLDVDTWYWIPQPRSFAEEAMCRAYLTHYFDMAESDQKKVRFLVQGARYLLQAPTVANIEGPWKLRQLMGTGTPAKCTSTDISTWIRLPQPRNAADRIMGEYYLRTWQLLPSARRDSVFYKIDGLSSMGLRWYNAPGGTSDGIYSLLAGIDAGSPTSPDASTDTDITTWQAFDVPRNEAEMLRSQVHLAQWETLAVLDRAKIRLKPR